MMRLEGKLDLVLGKLDLVLERLDAIRASYRAVSANIWVMFAALTAIIIGAIAAAPVIFDLGSKVMR